MPELREVYFMVTEQRAPAPGALDRQRDRQHRSIRNRKLGTIALSAALVVAVILVVALAGTDAFEGGRRSNQPAVQPTVLPTAGAYLFDLDTGQRTRVGNIESPGYLSPGIAVSRDGSMVAYSGNDGERLVIYVANADGTDIRPLEETGRDGAAVGPQFSPDGSQIVYQAQGPGNLVGDVFVVDVATGATTRVTDLEPVHNDLWYMGPQFSPDGRTILFTSPRASDTNQEWDLWSVPVSGGTPELVLRGAIGGHLSPDGRRLAYFEPNPSHNDPFRGDMWLADADGSNPRRVTGVQGDVFSARWSPVGTRIAYTEHASRSAYVVDLTTGEVTKVLDDITEAFPEWVDNHTWIVGDD
jgi:Tol biopolymer transport system component